MPVIRGDRIAESQRLNRRSVAVQNFYALLVSKVPDDFLRFRRVPVLILGALYPRREVTPGLLRSVSRMLDQLGTALPEGGPGAEPLWQEWVVDGVRFAELLTGKPRGNRYHRTPEPPWSEHDHAGACLPTALARTREWGPRTRANGAIESVEWLACRIREIRERKRGIRPLRPLHPLHDVTNTPQPPAGAGGNGQGPAGTLAAERKAARLRIEDQVELARQYAIHAGHHPNRHALSTLRWWFRGGWDLAAVQAAIDQGELRNRPKARI